MNKIKQLEKENKKLKDTIESLRKIGKKLLNKNFEMRKLLLKKGIDFEDGFKNLLKEMKIIK